MFEGNRRAEEVIVVMMVVMLGYRYPCKPACLVTVLVLQRKSEKGKEGKAQGRKEVR